jgi:two-component system, OmpR family, sensor histidine kinase VicK
MMHEGELKDKCALCGKLIVVADSDNAGAHDDFASSSPNPVIEETIQNINYKFDTRDCATMFKRFLDVYGNQFQPILGHRQYISDPFWDRILPKEDEIKEIRAQEKAYHITAGEEDIKDKKSEVVSLIKDSYQIQKLTKQLIESAREDIALAVPMTVADIFFSSPHAEEISSSFSCSVFFQLIKDAAADNKKLNVKILTNAEREKEKKPGAKDLLSDLKQGEEALSNIHIKHIEQDYSSLNENMAILVVDRKASLAIELEEEEKEKDEEEERKGSDRTSKRNGSYRTIKLATYSQNKSTVLSYISIFESLWKEIELNERITSLLAEIKRRETIERDFINMAAHELRTPIQPVLGLAQILQTKKNVDTKEQGELLSVIIRNARRLNILTENLLDLAKIESNTLKLQKETFSLTELIFEAIADMKSQLSSNEVIVNVEYNDRSARAYNDNDNHKEKKAINSGSKILYPNDNPPPVLVDADKTRIMQVISNLLTNAIKFTRGGKVAIIIDINNNRTKPRKEKERGGEREVGQGEGELKQGEETGREIVVSFRDSGTGIDQAIIDKIFEKFITKSEKGTGLGLFISRKIVEAHGGSIWAKNNNNADGATIAFSLPQPVNSEPAQ